MFTFISQNLGTILISLALTAIVALIVIKLVRDSKKPGCCAGCKGCSAGVDCESCGEPHASSER